MENRWLAVGIGLAVILIGLFAVVSHTSYQKFEVDQNFTEERVYASCHCFGSLAVMQSYPPQFDCSGINYCRDVNYTRER